jgi:hypothetical protein
LILDPNCPIFGVRLGLLGKGKLGPTEPAAFARAFKGTESGLVVAREDGEADPAGNAVKGGLSDKAGNLI